MIVGLVGGGVVINPMQTVRAIEFKTDEADRVEGIRTGALENAHPEAIPGGGIDF